MWSARLLAVCFSVLCVHHAQGIKGGSISSGIPWQAGVYFKDRDNLICGGTLVRPDVVISSAKCFFDQTSAKRRSPDQFRIALGKRKSSIQDKENTAQIFEVKDIVIPERFLGMVTRYSYDIAVVRLKGRAVLGSAVRPAGLELHRKVALEHQVGQVAGWGITEEDHQSEDLREINVPYITIPNCIREVPSSFQQFITRDKFCAGLNNGTTACPGDTGGGFIVDAPGAGDRLLVGVVSLGQPPKGAGSRCSDGITLFTIIAEHREWLQQHIDSTEDM